MDTTEIHAELERIRADFRHLVTTADPADLHRPSNGTKWTNEQLLFHMLFGYLLVQTLRHLVRGLSRLPDTVSAGFAALLRAGTRPFHKINYQGSLGGARVLGRARMVRVMDHAIDRLEAALARETDASLARHMHFPTGWDPYFRDVMALRDVYHYPTQHYEHHRRQLTLGPRSRPGSP
jgi:hypothetical protein